MTAEARCAPRPHRKRRGFPRLGELPENGASPEPDGGFHPRPVRGYHGRAGKALGMSRMTFHARFPSKTTLVEAALLAQPNEIEEQLEETCLEKGPGGLQPVSGKASGAVIAHGHSFRDASVERTRKARGGGVVRTSLCTVAFPAVSAGRVQGRDAPRGSRRPKQGSELSWRVQALTTPQGVGEVSRPSSAARPSSADFIKVLTTNRRGSRG